jgi:glycosyltransferase involved in cell wall biosynthesis
LTAHDCRITYLRLATFGRSLALNAAVRRARGNVIAFTDDDCAADPRWLELIVASFQADRTVGIVAGDLVPSPKARRGLSICPATKTIDCTYRPAESGFRGPPGFYWAGANFAVRREVSDRVGPFDEELGPGTAFPAAEDVDYALRAEALGVVMRTRPDIVIHHVSGRRYGLRAVLRHQRGYGKGSGALGAKLKLLDHRLWYEWSAPRSMATIARDLLRRPAPEALRLFRAHYAAVGRRMYLERFAVDERGVSRAR